MCSTIKNDKQWCKIKFGSGTTQFGAERNQEFTELLTRLKLPLSDPGKAVQEVARPVQDWTATTVSEHLATMFAIALWDTAPNRVAAVVAAIREHADRFLAAIKDDGQRFRAGQYEVDAARGCVQLTEGEFSTMVRTPFARPFDPTNRGERRCAH